MDLQAAIRSQYNAALDMMARSIEQCPDEMWNHPDDHNKFWQVAYHALFYVHLYMHPRNADFQPWKHHRQAYHRMGMPPEADSGNVPYTQAEALDFLSWCRQEIDRLLPLLDFDGPSGFDWLPFSKLELQFYNLRHLHQHVGELCERLHSRHHLDVDWVGRHPVG